MRNSFFLDYDVTKSALAVIAKRLSNKISCTLFSFEIGNRGYLVDPLDVKHFKKEVLVGSYPILNFWELKQLENHIIDQYKIKTWPELLEVAKLQFPNLDFGDILKHPKCSGMPNNIPLFHNILSKLEILNQYAEDYLNNGKEGQIAKNLKKEFFHGDKAWFSDESPTNKIVFKNQLRFKSKNRGKVSAPMHGKINEPAYRIHFEWPFNNSMKKLEILYIGPKITV